MLLRSMALMACIHATLGASPVFHEAEIEEVIVTATRTPQKRGHLGSSVYVLNRKTIEASGKSSVVDLLRTVPGVFVKTTGGLGGATSISLRGIAYKYALVLVDGMKLADYMGNGGSGQPVLDHLILDDVEQIEVVYGSQSTLWGSDAVGGVVQIITRTGQGKKKAWISQEIGSYKTIKSSLGFSGANHHNDFSVSISRLDRDGFSEAKRTNPSLFGGNAEDDGYANLSARVNLGFSHKGGSKTRFLLNKINTKKDIDGFFDSNGPADQNSKSETHDLYYRLEHKRSQGKLDESFSFSFSKFDSSSKLDTISAFGPFKQDTRFVGKVRILNWQRDYAFGEHGLTLGWELEQDRGSNLTEQGLKTRATSYYLQARLNPSKNFSLGLGARQDQHSNFGNHQTWKISPSLRRGSTRFFGSLGTSFKAPTLFELNSQQKFANNLNQLVLVNNPNLLPALGRGWNLGVEKDLGRDAVMSLTVFQNDIDNTVKFLFPPFPQVIPFGFVNIGSVKSKGFEIAFDKKVTKKFSYQSHFTRSRAREFPAGTQLRRQPRHQFNLNLLYQSTSEETLTLMFQRNGAQVERYATAFGAAQITESAKVIDFSYQKKLENGNQWGLRIENLLDWDYEEVFGYRTAGRSYYLSYKHEF
jgi:vitamin B12 transporter